ncbi:MAG TPA: adenylate/guanylate cyclase domain-containing protein [Coriobacteriia bacterium]|nr:adenylate/guanylate cyclase domain-containing protein [Coriobacteriia bacterium]
MADTLTRHNAGLLRAISAVLFGVALLGAVSPIPLYAPPVRILLAVLVAAVAYLAPPNAAIFLVLIAAVPVIATDIIVGTAVLVVGLLLTQYLALGRATGFLLLALAAVLVPINAEWAIVVLAGYLLGAARGAAVAALACVVLEAAGIAVGASALGSLIIGSNGPGTIVPGLTPDAVMGLEWVRAAVAEADFTRLLTAFREITAPVVLLVQPALWAGAAAVSGALGRSASWLRAIVGAVGAIVILAVGSAALSALAGTGTAAPVLLTAVVSLAVVLVVTALDHSVFRRRPAVATAPTAETQPTETDVDDLLRIIASAEDELAARHRAEAVVLITDMKSFSAMTEEIGSIESAKLVQRHRDLLLPLIERHGGNGTSTGGDGLVAAFASAEQALLAAADMQRTLSAYCEGDPTCPELLVRIGVAAGEVVLDKGGRPFLGAALNLAARVMELADGGRIMTTGGVAAALPESPGLMLHRHGEFKLKNIAEPLPIVEVLWRDGQTPQEIRAV